MKIALINGSPKVNNSTSGILLKNLKSALSKRAEVAEAGLHTASVSKEVLDKLRDADIWVIACPLYVDGIPAHFLSCLVQLEKEHFEHNKKCLYGIVNCGFYEGIQAETALKILRNWCVKAGGVWNGGIGVGGGGALSMTSGMPPEKGPGAPVYKELSGLADKLLKRESRENSYVSVAFPRFLYKAAAQAGWRQMIRANGKRGIDLGRQW